jgi:hypothetical protein
MKPTSAILAAVVMCLSISAGMAQQTAVVGTTMQQVTNAGVLPAAQVLAQKRCPPLEADYKGYLSRMYGHHMPGGHLIMVPATPYCPAHPGYCSDSPERAAWLGGEQLCQAGMQYLE